MIRVGVIGAGVIGSRVARAVTQQPDMILVGVAAKRPSANLLLPWIRSHPLFWSEAPFETDRPLRGCWRSLADLSDVIIDCGPRGTAKDRIDECLDRNAKVVIHGGEAASSAQADFCAGITPDPLQARVIRIPSCNTTGLLRVLAALRRLSPVSSLRAVLTRAASDGDKGRKGDVARLRVGLEATHHADDLRRIWPEIDARTLGCHAPTSRAHLVQLFVRFVDAPSETAIRKALGQTARVVLLEGAAGWGDDGRHLSTGTSDAAFTWVWGQSLDLAGRELALSMGVHMEAVVVPDTIDAVRLLAAGTPGGVSADITDRALGVHSGMMTTGSWKDARTGLRPVARLAV